MADAIKDVSQAKGRRPRPVRRLGDHHHRGGEDRPRRARAIELDPKYVDVAVRRGWDALHWQERRAGVHQLQADAGVAGYR